MNIHPNFTELNDTYSAGFEFGLYDNEITSSQYNLPFSKIIQFIKPNSTVLDWGCGKGHTTCFLLSQGFKTTAFDVCDALLVKDLLMKKWQNIFNHKVSSDGKNLPFDNATFDAVVSMGVLEHVRETGGDEVYSLTEISRILQPNGYFLCFHFPQKTSWIEMLSKILFPKKWIHTYTYSEENVYNMLKETNFKLLEIGIYNFLPRNIFTNCPSFLKQSNLFCKLYNLVDNLLTTFLPNISQNIYFIAQKQ